MLEIHFLRKFFNYFFIFFFSLVFIFGVSDFFVRLQVLGGILITPRLFFLMFPLMAQLTIPLASCLSIQTTVGNLFVEDDAILIYFLLPARKALHKAVLIFSLLILTFYVPLVFLWAPTSYQKGKKLILDIAKEQFYKIEPNRFYAINSELNFFFKKRFLFEKKVLFEKILLIFNQRNGNQYFANAQKGYLFENNLFLIKGTLTTLDKSSQYNTTFEDCKIDLNSLLNCKKEDENSVLSQPKFLTLLQLRDFKNIKTNFYIEYYKRIAQVVWQFMFPFLALWGIVIFGKRKSNLLLSILLSGILFLVSYFCLNLVSCLNLTKFNIYFFLHFPLVLISFIFYFLYCNKK
ncbi:LptF/LptG family permease [Candidatus Dependentiae bacterium]